MTSFYLGCFFYWKTPYLMSLLFICSWIHEQQHCNSLCIFWHFPNLLELGIISNTSRKYSGTILNSKSSGGRCGKYGSKGMGKTAFPCIVAAELEEGSRMSTLFDFASLEVLNFNYSLHASDQDNSVGSCLLFTKKFGVEGKSTVSLYFK